MVDTYFFEENIKDCYKKHKEISNEFAELFKDTKAVDVPKSKHPFDKSGKSFTKDIYLYCFLYFLANNFDLFRK